MTHDEKDTELMLTREQAKEAVEFWLNAKFLRKPGTVMSLDFSAQGAQFVVRFRERGPQGDTGNE